MSSGPQKRLRHVHVKMMARKTQLRQTKGNLSSKTECCKQGKGGTTRFVFGRGSGRHQRSICKGETLQDSAPVTESEQDFCSQSGDIVDMFENQLETLKPKGLQHRMMTQMLETKQAKQQRRILFEQERCAQRKAW